MITLQIKIQNKNLYMEADTGSVDSFISYKNWIKLGKPTLQNSPTSYRCVNGTYIQIYCKFSQNVSRADTKATSLIEFTVTDHPSLNLLGLNAIKKIKNLFYD